MTALAIFVFAAVAQLAVSGAYHILQPGLLRGWCCSGWTTPHFVLIAASFVPVHVILFKGWQRWLILLVWFHSPPSVSRSRSCISIGCRK